MEIPRPPHLKPPRKKLLERLVPKQHFFQNLKPAAILRQERRDAMQAGQSRLPRGVMWGIAGLVALFVVGFAITLVLAKRHAANSMAARADTLQAGIADLQNFDPQGAQAKFAALNGVGDVTSFSGVLQSFTSLISGGSGALSSLTDLTKQLSILSQQAVVLKEDLFVFLSSNSSSLVSDLDGLRGVLAALDADTSKLSSMTSFMGNQSPLAGDDYASLKTQLAAARNFLDVFVPWLASGASHHVLIFLQNPSEIRATGGFLGSYADITIASGTISDIAVHDINDIDTAFKENIVPPKPLQLEVKRLRPADANWFFDFPTSAAKVISFFERAQSSSSYDGAIAISPKIVSDLLAVTGPIKLPASKTSGALTFDSNNFLIQIQNLVQQGQANSATYPKQVLRDLSEAIFQKLASSTDDQRQALLSSALDWINGKDVMAYFKDPAFQNFLMNYGATGDVYSLPQKFNGDYLAVVDTNINGQKSDIYVSSTVSWVAQIAEDGTVTNELSIVRKHNGNTSPYWWYSALNQDYLQIFVPDGSVLTDTTGGSKKTITAPINYLHPGGGIAPYAIDPTVATIESSTRPFFSYPTITSHEESGKEVFATWVRTAAGQSTKTTFSYTHRLFITPAAGVQYQFVFEKQAGTNRNYSFEVDAPLGYVFAENGIASWTYQSNDPPGRMIVNLTLQKL